MPRNLQNNKAYQELKDSLQNQNKTRFLYVPSVYSTHCEEPGATGVIGKFMAPVKGEIQNIHIYVGSMQKESIMLSILGVDMTGSGTFVELPVRKGHNEFNEHVLSLGDGSRIAMKVKDAENNTLIHDVFLGFTFHPDLQSFGVRIKK